MKRSSTTAVLILAICFLFPPSVFSAEPQPGPTAAPCMAQPPQSGPGQHDLPLPYGVKLLLDYQQINILAELTGLPQENIRQMTVCAPVPMILEKYGVDPEAFRSAMDRQTVKLVNQAAAVNIISKKQAEDILKRMSRVSLQPYPRKQGD